MNIIEYNQLFGTEEKCIEHFKKLRIDNGLKCRNCKCEKHYWIKSKLYFRCSNLNCKKVTTLRSGTVMMHSNFGFKVWYDILYLLSKTDENYSMLSIQRKLNKNRYESTWYTIHKIRLAFRNSNCKIDFENFQLVGRKSTTKQKKYNYIPTATIVGLRLNNLNQIDKIQFNHLRVANIEKDVKYRCSKIIELPSEGQRERQNHSCLEQGVDLTYYLKKARYILKRIHRQVSDYFLQLFLDELSYRENHKHEENYYINTIKLLI